MPSVHFMTLDPGHFHASLVQKEMYPGVDPRVDVYAPLGTDLLEHLGRIAAFNTRAEHPTSWRLEIHTGPDYFDRMLAEHPGNVVIISGKNREKIGRIQRSVETGLNVLADKPWILRSADLPALEQTLADADRKGVVAYDIMTERFEVTSELQRALVGDTMVSGGIGEGTAEKPGVYMESVHHLMKLVAGAPNIRPAWFFDTAEQGEGLNDIGTHLADLVQWTLFPDQAIDYRREVKVLGAQAWPTPINEADFKKVTGGQSFPASVQSHVKDGVLQYRLQHAGLVHAAGRPRHAERDLGLGGAGGRRRPPLRRLPRPESGDRGPPDEGGRLSARAVRRPEHARRRRCRRSRGQGAAGGAAGRVRRRLGGAARSRDPRRDSGPLSRRPRGALRRRDAALPVVPEGSVGAAVLGAAEHGREVLRDDDRDRAEPPGAGEGRAAAGAGVGVARSQ